MRIHGWLIGFALVSLQSPALQTGNKPSIHPIVKEASDYVVVLPEKSLALQREHQDLLDKLTVEEKIMWHMTTLKAALPLSDLTTMSDAFTQVIVYQDEPSFQNERAFYLNSLGAWMRRNQHYQEARLAYFCSITNATESNDRLRSLLNLAIVERNNGNPHDAQALNYVALNLASLVKNEPVIASIENNLGILSLTQGDLETAEQHFKRALDYNRRLIRRGSEILSGINLLHTFVRQQNYAYYERLYPRINRLADRFGQNARSAYLDWIHSVYLHRTQTPVTESEKRRLAARYNELNDAGIQKMLFPFATELAIEVDAPETFSQKDYEGQLMSDVRFCDWGQFQSMSYDTLLDNIGHYLSEKSTL